MRILNLWYKDKIIGELSHKEVMISTPEFTGKVDTITFNYTQTWLNDSSSFALSPHLPLQEDFFTGDVVWNFFENIIPEGQSLYEINRYLQRRRTDLLGFLSQFGRDLPCAFQILSEDEKPLYTGEVQEFSFADLENYTGPLLLFAKRKSLSLAGAQNKMGTVIRDGKLYIPMDSAPTTHIIKAYKNSEHPSCALNEFLMMKLAKAVGLNVPDTFYHNNYVIVERYDRNNNERLHQIDLCQYYNRRSEEKYEDYKDYFPDTKGLTLKDYFTALRHFKNGELQLLQWISYNYLIGNTDNHGKNISLLYKNNQWQIAPFYDMVCTSLYEYQQLPYTINGENNIFCLDEDDFLHEMENNNVNPEDFIQIYTDTKERILDEFEKITQQYDVNKDFIKKLTKELRILNERLSFKNLSSRPQLI